MRPQVALALGLVVSCLLWAPFAADAQQSNKAHRIGFLMPSDSMSRAAVANREAFEAGMREHGYIPGQNIVIEYRYTDARDERAPALAVELARLKVDLVVAWGTAQVLAAKEATNRIPIVMGGVIDPVGRGLVANLARPGGNVTGMTATAGAEMAGKHLQVLKDTVSGISRVAVLAYMAGPPNPAYRKELETAAEALGVKLQFYAIQDAGGLDAAFVAMTRAREEALLLSTHPFMTNHAPRIVGLAARSRLPAVYQNRVAVEFGGLMAYGANQPDRFRGLAAYVDKVLKGARPSNLPVEQPTTFELVINLKTAKALGLTIPPSVLMRADEIIE